MFALQPHQFYRFEQSVKKTILSLRVCLAAAPFPRSYFGCALSKSEPSVPAPRGFGGPTCGFFVLPRPSKAYWVKTEEGRKLESKFIEGLRDSGWQPVGSLPFSKKGEALAERRIRPPPRPRGRYQNRISPYCYYYYYYFYLYFCFYFYFYFYFYYYYCARNAVLGSAVRAAVAGP